MTTSANDGAVNKNSTAVYLAVTAVVQLILYVVLTSISEHFSHGSDNLLRPIGTVLLLLATAFVLYLGSLYLAIRLPDTKRLIWSIVGVAILFRVVVLFSQPIQEVDIYRYIWDGAVANEGISPYRYPPQQAALAATNSQQGAMAAEFQLGDDDVSRLAKLVIADRGMQDVLQRVHYSELPTVYPPISQVVFRASDWLTPRGADVGRRLLIMKTLIVGCDIGTMVLLILLLGHMGLHRAWCIVYGWAPLVIKEFANSGHLDSIAVCLMMAAIVICVVRTSKFAAIASAGVLGLAFGAKLFPIVLAPLLAILVWKKQGLKIALGWCVGFAVVAGASIAPMISARMNAPPEQMDGLQTFLTRWEINDLLFMTVEENVRPEGAVAGQPPLWFVITSNRLRTSVTKKAGEWFGNEERAPFLLTRTMLLGVLGLISLGLCYRTWGDPNAFCESAFLTMAWFWFLAPTQNPWYWTWALPLLPFVRQRVWLLVSGLVLIYYARFWYQYHGGGSEQYKGVAFFDFVIVWIEFAPFLMLLAIDRIRTGWSRPEIPAG